MPSAKGLGLAAFDRFRFGLVLPASGQRSFTLVRAVDVHDRMRAVTGALANGVIVADLRGDVVADYST